MTISPLLPLWILLPAVLLLGAFAVRQALTHRGTKLFIDWTLRLALVVLLLVLALRPAIPGSSEGPTATGGLEVYFVVDTTSSMAADDLGGAGPDGVTPATRLDGVKADVSAIATELTGAQFSLVTFDSSAVQRVPLTSDVTALESAANVMTQEVTSYSSGSSIDGAVGLMTTVLRDAQTENPGVPRVLFYFGDGEQTQPTEPGSFEPLAEYITGGGVFGYGTADGGRMREFTGLADGQGADGPAYIQDRSVDPPVDAISTLDEETLGTIATQLGVKYAHRTSAASLRSLLSGIEVGPLSVPSEPPGQPIEFYWIVALPIGLLLLRETIGVATALRQLRPARRI